MITFKHILFPVDFSDRSRASRSFVLSAARHFNARLTLLNIVQIPDAWYGFSDGSYPVFLDMPEMKDEALGRLDVFLDRPDPALKITRVADQGDPSHRIISYAEENGVDLIMMPTHGYGAFRNLLLGSVTAKVLHDAKCSVCTTAHSEDLDSSSGDAFKSVLCAINLTPESVCLIRYADDFATEYGAKLRLVHAVSVAENRPENYLETDFRRFLFQEHREEIAKLQEKAGTQLEVCMEGGSVSSVIRGAAQHHDADLLITGRGRLQHTLGRLRSNSYAIIRDAPCPVLSM